MCLLRGGGGLLCVGLLVGWVMGGCEVVVGGGLGEEMRWVFAFRRGV